MARKQALKVYRTPIGFHDAYVAAPSQKAALEAWGTDRNLFARGIAEIVDDPALAEEPLAKPGTVIKRSRGTAAEQIAALPSDQPTPDRARKPSASGKEKSSKVGIAKAAVQPRTPKPQPRPSRETLDQAEARLAIVEARQKADKDDLDRRERALTRERDRLGNGAEARDKASRAGRRSRP